MLLSFRVENYRSLRDSQELDLRAAYRSESPALPVAALYGANASGKSTLLDALRYMHDAVTGQGSGWKGEGKIPRKPFLLDESSREKPSSFAVELLLDGVRYEYGFTINDRYVEQEWCFSYPKKVRRVIFDRTRNNMKFGTTTQSARSELLAELTPSSILFITTAARSSHEVFRPVYDWFKDRLWFLSPKETYGSSITRNMLIDPKKAGAVLELLKAADLGISHVEFRVEEVEVERPGEASKKAISPRKVAGGRRSARRYLEAAQERTPSIRLKTGDRAVDVVFDGPPEQLADFVLGMFRDGELRFTHAGTASAEFSFNEESHGTRTWFGLIGMSLQALQGKFTLVIDELDTSLHPLLVAEFIKLFQRGATNGLGAQLIMSTHDTSLLGRHGGDELLRRDQVWFAQKDHETGASSVFPLTDFKPPAGLNWEKRYLGGAVGALPFIDEDRLARAVDSVNGDDDE